MVENHQKINKTEIAALIVAACGIALISSTIAPNIKVDFQKNLADAVHVLDFSDRYQQPLAIIQFVFDTQGNFLEEFYIAFQQVATLPQADMDSAKNLVNGILVYSESVAKDYAHVAYQRKDYVGELVLAINENQHSRVAGAVIEHQDVRTKNQEDKIASSSATPSGLLANSKKCGESARPSKTAEAVYTEGYQAPDLSLIKNKIISAYEKLSY